MKKLFLCAASALLCIICQAQEAEDFNGKYQRLSKAFGPASVGVESLIERWEQAEPESKDMYLAKFNFYLAKSHSRTAVPMDKVKYMGKAPVLEIPDSTGKKIKYFEDEIFVDSLFARAINSLEKAIGIDPLDVSLHYAKILTYISYEKESPDIALSETLKWMENNRKNHPEWVNGNFEEYLQNCCWQFYSIASPKSYEAFRKVSEQAVKDFPANVNFQNNLGAYWMTAKNNPKKALKYYESVLKKDPTNQAAALNIRIAKKKIAAK